MNTNEVALGNKNYAIRESGIELVKIIAMFFIVISHVCLSLIQESTEIKEVLPSFVDATLATTNIQNIIIAFFYHFGVLGNNIFLAASFWFLCDSDKLKVKKVFVLLIDVWVISILFLALYFSLGESMSLILIIKCIFPNLFSSNWFVTCYILIYLIHPFLNTIINKIAQRTHVIICLVLLVLYCGICFVKGELLFYTNLIHFVVMYFVISYIRRYLDKCSNNLNRNIFLLIIGLLGIVMMLFTTNILGLHFSFFSNKLLKWSVNNNPFVIMTAIALFNIFKQIKFVNPFINYLSSLTLFIYLIHENPLLRGFTRVRIWAWIIEEYGYEYIVLQMFIFAVMLFAASVMVSALYKLTIHRIVLWIELYIEKVVMKLTNNVVDRIIEMK